MRKALLSICLSFALAAAMGQSKPEARPETLVAPENAFDFGRIPQGKPVTHIFRLSNAGKEPLVIENVQASCGCTTPEWNNAPVAAGGNTDIKVGYNSASEGPFEKTITITYNKGQIKVLTIKGNVWKTSEQPAPRNVSLNLLKNVN